MKPATDTKRLYEHTKLMIVSQNQITHSRASSIVDFLKEGDLLIVNTSATLPSSFIGIIERNKLPVEIRLAAFRGASTRDLRCWSAISFGEGDWRMPTEHRGTAPNLLPGDRIRLSPSLAILVHKISQKSNRLLEVEFESKSLVRDLYLQGRPIQYSYVKNPLQIWDQQSLLSGPPVSVEPPSALFPLSWDLLFKFKEKGVRLAPIIHSAGISSTGNAVLDAELPLEEYFEVSDETRSQIISAKKNGHRIIAVGTSAVRAVESSFTSGLSQGLTSLKLGPQNPPQVIQLLITGMHEEGTSHGELMKAFCNCDLLRQAEREANALEYRNHEFGDWTLLDCSQTA